MAVPMPANQLPPMLGQNLSALGNTTSYNQFPMGKSPGFFQGAPAQLHQASRLSPEQLAILNQLLPGIGGQLAGNNLDFGPIADRAREQFSKHTIPSLAARFAGLGSGGSMRGSAFQDALGSSAADLESQLASGEAQYGLQKQGMLQQLLALLMQPNIENFYTPQQPGTLAAIAGPLANAASRYAATYALGGL